MPVEGGNCGRVSGVVAPDIFAPGRETRAANRSSALDCQPSDNVRRDIYSAHNSPAYGEVSLGIHDEMGTNSAKCHVVFAMRWARLRRSVMWYSHEMGTTSTKCHEYLPGDFRVFRRVTLVLAGAMSRFGGVVRGLGPTACRRACRRRPPSSRSSLP